MGTHRDIGDREGQGTMGTRGDRRRWGYIGTVTWDNGDVQGGHRDTAGHRTRDNRDTGDTWKDKDTGRWEGHRDTW